MIALLSWLAVAACGLFAGGALYTSVVEHPARAACGPPMAVAQFRTGHSRAVWLQASLAGLGCLGALVAWLAGAPAAWLGAGLVLGLGLAGSGVLLAPTDRRLLDRALAPDAPEARRLLRRWGTLHLVRTAVGLVAFGWMLRLAAAPP